MSLGYAACEAIRSPEKGRKSDGMGIGLSVSRSIIESHQGHLWAAPNDGPGATFSFSIPCEPESDTAKQEVRHQ
jgi:signal transduction histidine kinase